MEELNVKLLLPSKYSADLTKLFASTKRLYFIAGPILGADDWQAEAIRLFAKHDPGCAVACPCRYDSTHPLYRYQIDPSLLFTSSTDVFPDQTTWERWLIKMAMTHGCLMFWLPLESKINSRPKDKGPYARDTYGEIGRYFTHARYNNNWRVAMGAQPEFPGLRQILSNLTDEYNGQNTRYCFNTLEETVIQSVELAKLHLIAYPRH